METGEISLEHIQALSNGGPKWKLHNLALAHKDCNVKAGNLSIEEKMRMKNSK